MGARGVCGLCHYAQRLRIIMSFVQAY